MKKSISAVGAVLLGGLAWADLHYVEIGKVEMGSGMKSAMAGGAGGMDAHMAKSAKMSADMMESLETRNSVWIAKGRKKYIEDLSAQSKEQMGELVGGGVEDAQKTAMDNMLKSPMFAAMPMEQREKIMKQMQEKMAQAGGGDVKQAAKTQAASRKGIIRIFDFIKGKRIVVDPNRRKGGQTEERSLKDLREEHERMKKLQADINAFVEKFTTEYAKGDKKKVGTQVVAVETGEEMNVEGIQAKLYQVQVVFTVEGKRVPLVTVELAMAQDDPELTAAAKELYASEDEMVKELGQLSVEGGTSADFLYKSSEPWAKEAIKKMRGLKGFPVMRRIGTDPGQLDIEELIQEKMKDPEVQARLKQGVADKKAEALARRERCLTDPKEKAQMYADAAGFGIAREEVDRFMKDPGYYEALMTNMAARMMPQIARSMEEKVKDMNVGYRLTMVKVKTGPLATAEFDVPEEYRAP